MKILLIGAATSNHTKRWVNSLSRKGHEVLLLCRGDQVDDHGEIDRAVKIHYLKFGGGIGYYLNVIEARKVYKAFKPEVVNAHYATGYGTMARLAALRPLVISCWGSDVYEYPYLGKRNRNMLKKNLVYADAIASTSYAMAEQAKWACGDNNKKVTVTPFGVDVKKFAPKEKEKHDRPVIGIVKYLEPIYDIPLLIKAFSIVYKNEEIKPILEIYGDGSLKKELIALTQELAVKDDVHFNGTIPNTQVPDVLNSFDVFVNCSKAESFGVAVVEAMACKIPVIVTDTEGFKEVVVDGKTGIVLKDRKPETMADALTLLLHDKELSSEMGENGRKRVLDIYDWDKNVTLMENLYEDVINDAK